MPNPSDGPVSPPVAGPTPASLAPLDYRASADPAVSSQARSTRIANSLRNVFVTAFATTIVLFILGGVVPRLDATFRSFDIQLPLVTRIILGTSRLFVSTWMWITGPAIVIALATCAALLPVSRRAMRLLIGLILIGVVLTLMLGILLPLVNLWTSLTGGTKP